MSYKVSVIIPVYNAEKYIVECLESLLNQTLLECEFIFINDGSKDSSKSVIERYCKKDARIKLINQENQGVSMARNRGLHAANGEYVGFVDADDYIDKDMYKILFQSTKQSDCDAIIANIESEIDGYKRCVKYAFPVNKILDKQYIQQHLLPYFLKSDDLNTVCNKIYKNKIIRDHHVKFPDRVVLGEDGMFNMQFMNHAATVKYIDYTGYHYRETAGSATRNLLHQDYFGRALEVFHMEFSETYTSQINKREIRQFKSIKLINNVMSYIHIYFRASKDIGYWQRYRYVKHMIANPNVREAITFYTGEVYNSLGRYEKLIVELIKRKSTIGLYYTTAYSRFRNK